MFETLKSYRSFYALVAVSALFGGLASSILAPYVRGLGFDAAHYGLFAASIAIGSLVGGLVGGFLSDLASPKILVVFSALLSALGYAILSANGAESLVVAALLLGIAGGAGGAALLILAVRMQSASSKSLEEPIVALQATSLIATSFGMLLGWIPVVVSTVSGLEITFVYRGALLACGLGSAVLVLLLVRKIPPVVGKRGSERNPLAESSGDKIDLKPLAKLVFVGLLISFGAGLSVHIIDFYFTKKFGFDSGRLGTLMSAQNLLMGLGMFMAQRVSRELGNPIKTYIIISSTSVPLLIAMTFVSSPLLASSIYVARTFFMNIANPLYQAFELSLVPDRYRGRFLAFLNVASIVPAAVGRALGGALMTYDLELPLRLTALIYAIAFILLAIWFPKAAPTPTDFRKIGNLLVKTMTPIIKLYSLAK
ncbi:MAG: MFS transporter [Acidilobaceae archaeon]